MINNVYDAGPRKTRQQIVNPHADVPYQERLRRVGAIDLRDNAVIERLAGGYIVAHPIDPNKRIGR